MDIDGVVIHAGEFAIIDFNKPAAAGKMHQIRPARAGAAGTGPRRNGDVVEGKIFAKLGNDAQTMQEIKRTVLPFDILAAHSKDADTIADNFTKLKYAAPFEVGIVIKKQSQLERRSSCTLVTSAKGLRSSHERRQVRPSSSLSHSCVISNPGESQPSPIQTTFPFSTA